MKDVEANLLENPVFAAAAQAGRPTLNSSNKVYGLGSENLAS